MSYLRWVLIPAIAFSLIGCATTKIDWEIANRVNTPKAYKEFLEKHPDSEFSKQAEARMEPIIYQKAVDEGKVGSFSSYLVKLPHGAHITDARKKIQEARCLDPNIIQTFPSWLRKGKANEPERHASWLLDKSFIGASGDIGRGYKAIGDDPAYPLELGWGAGHLIYYDGKGVIVGPDGTQVLVGYDCK